MDGMTVTFRSGTGLLVVDPVGARVAELRLDPDGPNLLWRGSATPFPGGDRLWVAPEVPLFYDGDPTDRANWRVPEGLDPGDWQVHEHEGSVRLEQQALGATMRRRIEPLVEPPVPIDLSWAGYRLADEVSADEPWSAWHLVMVPTPGDVFVRGARDPLEMVAPAAPLEDGWVRPHPEDQPWKLGFDPPGDGRVVLAVVGDDDPGPLVVVLAVADPAGSYVDVPPQGGRATAVQVWNAGADGFTEIEHHAPLEQPVLSSTVLGVWGARSERLGVLAALSGAPEVTDRAAPPTS